MTLFFYLFIYLLLDSATISRNKCDLHYLNTSVKGIYNNKVSDATKIAFCLFFSIKNLFPPGSFL